MPTSNVLNTGGASSSMSTNSGGILKRKSVTEEGGSSQSSQKNEHVRIRSPSPDLDIRPILVR